MLLLRGHYRVLTWTVQSTELTASNMMEKIKYFALCLLFYCRCGVSLYVCGTEACSRFIVRDADDK